MIQQALFNQETTPEERHIQAYSLMWYFFFDAYGLMLLNEHIDSIVEQVGVFNTVLNADKKKVNEHY